MNNELQWVVKSHIASLKNVGKYQLLSLKPFVYRDFFVPLQVEKSHGATSRLKKCRLAPGEVPLFRPGSAV